MGYRVSYVATTAQRTHAIRIQSKDTVQVARTMLEPPTPDIKAPIYIDTMASVATQNTSADYNRFAARLALYRNQLKHKTLQSVQKQVSSSSSLRAIPLPDWRNDGMHSITDLCDEEQTQDVKKAIILKRTALSIIIGDENRMLYSTKNTRRCSSSQRGVKKGSLLYKFLTPMSCTARSGHDRKIESKIHCRKYLNPLLLHNNFVRHAITMDKDKAEQQ